MAERLALMLALVKNVMPFVCEAAGITVALIFGLMYAAPGRGKVQTETAAAVSSNLLTTNEQRTPAEL